jgi:hypothetical protein
LRFEKVEKQHRHYRAGAAAINGQGWGRRPRRRRRAALERPHVKAAQVQSHAASIVSGRTVQAGRFGEMETCPVAVLGRTMAGVGGNTAA